MGKRAAGRAHNRRGGTLAAGNESGEWDQGQTQVCDVGFVFSCRALGVLWPQSHFIGNSSGDRRKARSKHWRSCQCEASRSTLVLVTRASETSSRTLEFRDQLLVFLDGALGTRRGELGALRWSDCDFDSMSFSVQHSYYWRRGGHLRRQKRKRRRSYYRCIWR